MENMTKRLFSLLLAFVFITMGAYLLILKRSGDNKDAISDRKDANSVPSHNTVLPLNGFWSNETEKKTAVTTLPVLPECPEEPPELVGPLLVEFNFMVNLDDLSKEYKDTLQDGGRYKPPDCKSKHKVAVIISFRNRYEHLKYWLHYLHPILMRQQLDYGVFVINQDGEGIFNRAKLLNAGYVEALKVDDYECFVFSDVDLVPLDDRNLYRCFDNPRHLAVGMDKFNFGLPYRNFFGGVSSFSKNQYMKINGFSNTFWGWGGEDDDVYNRIISKGMSLSRPNMVIGKYRMIKHKHDLHNEPNPVNAGKLSKTRITMDSDGMNTLKYTVKKIEKNVLYTFITVDIEAPIK
ncbi:beta-1,4-galactosyltransferase 1-like [Eucyclogobius newberryi]|uniref:beta-1,4-galactosyltransferase 1-like n=1 Tax=Eucyclogobius newberryi TaxID=166745 RepID=UPI003B59CC80